MDRTPHRYVGRGLEAPGGKPFGYLWHMERAEIRRHLLERGWQINSAAIEFRISRIQERIHKYKPTMRQRQQAWAACQQPRMKTEAFSTAELQRLVDLFSGANDPVTASIAEKAIAMLKTQK